MSRIRIFDQTPCLFKDPLALTGVSSQTHLDFVSNSETSLQPAVYYQLSLRPTWSSITRHISQQTNTTSTVARTSIGMTQYLMRSCHNGKNGEQNCHFWRNLRFPAVLSPRISVSQCAPKSTASQMQATTASVKSRICVWSIIEAKFTSASFWPNPELPRLKQSQYLALS